MALDAPFNTVVYNLIAVGLLSTLIWKILQYGMRPKDYPPGPPTVPLLGNILQVPSKNFHHKFAEWAKRYGPIASLKLGGQTMILLNEPSAVRDLIEKRSNIYSVRPDAYIREFSGNKNILFRDNDDVWRRQRKMYHVRMNVKTSDQYVVYQHFDSVHLMNDLLDAPADFESKIQRYTFSIASTILYGWRTVSSEQTIVQKMMVWQHTVQKATALQLVDFYPFLRPLYRIIPARFSSYKRGLKEVREIENQLFIELLDDAKAKIEAGQVYPSFIRDMLLDKSEDRLNDVEIATNAAHGFSAAADTQWNTLMGFVKAMILFPEAQAQGHEEIDRVIGKDRMPTWEDREQLPVIRAMVEESLRWMPTTLTAAIPHSLLKDDVYKGYKIPAGAQIMINVWALNNHPQKEGRDFDPTRYDPKITAIESNAISQDSEKRMHFTFGAGRRVCPGFHIAERGLFIAISRLLWGFDFSRVKDADGNLIPIDRDAVTDGFIVKPEPYPCDVKVRDEFRAKMIRQQWAEQQVKLDSVGNYKEDFFKVKN